jgi:hypothetical protein
MTHNPFAADADLPEQSKQHEIDNQASALFVAAINKIGNPTELPRRSDFGKDYLIEVFQDGRPCGRSIYVQLKGTENAKIRRDGKVSFPLECKHLNYFLQEGGHPVFLVVVDVVKRKAWFCFMQAYIMERLDNVEWQSQETLTVHLTTELKGFDFDSLLADATAADNFMIAHKIRARKWQLQAMDPNMSVKITATDSSIHTKFSSKAPIGLELKGADPQVIDRALRGYEVSVTKEMIQFKGSPALSHIAKEFPGGKLRLGVHRRVTVNLVAANSGKEVAWVTGIRGTLHAAPIEERFSGALKDTPIEFVSHVKIKDGMQSGNAQIGLSLIPWYGQRIDRLKGFDSIKAFVEAAVGGADITAEGLKKNHIHPLGQLGVGAVELQQWQKLLSALEQARLIAARLKMYPELIRDHIPNRNREIERLYALLESKIYSGSASECSINVTIASDLSMEEATKASAGTQNIEMLGVLPFPFLGLMIPLNVRATLEQMHCENLKPIEGGYALTLNGTPTSTEKWEMVDTEVENDTLKMSEAS